MTISFTQYGFAKSTNVNFTGQWPAGPVNFRTIELLVNYINHEGHKLILIFKLPYAYLRLVNITKKKIKNKYNCMIIFDFFHNYKIM